MFFTATGRCYVERVFEIPEMGRASKGRSIANILELRPGEKIAATIRVQGQKTDTETWNENLHVVFATRSGIVKKSNLADFRNIRKGGIIAIKIEEGDRLIDCKLTTGLNERADHARRMTSASTRRIARSRPRYVWFWEFSGQRRFFVARRWSTARRCSSWRENGLVNGQHSRIPSASRAERNHTMKTTPSAAGSRSADVREAASDANYEKGNWAHPGRGNPRDRPQRAGSIIDLREAKFSRSTHRW